MNGFLDRLLARSYRPDVPNTIQPRPLARFETPEWSELSPASLQMSLPEEENIDAPVLPASSMDNRSSMPAALETHPQAIQDRLTSEHVPVDFGKRRPVQPSIELYQPADDMGKVGDQMERHLRIEGSAEGIEHITQVREILIPAPERKEAQPRAIQPSRPEPPTAQRPFPPGEHLTGPPSSIEPRREPEPQANSAMPPIVHLTIGKIEVNAPPAPVVARRTPVVVRPVRSLDDYLEQRNKR